MVVRERLKRREKSQPFTNPQIQLLAALRLGFFIGASLYIDNRRKWFLLSLSLEDRYGVWIRDIHGRGFTYALSGSPYPIFVSLIFCAASYNMSAMATAVVVVVACDIFFGQVLTFMV